MHSSLFIYSAFVRLEQILHNLQIDRCSLLTKKSAVDLVDFSRRQLPFFLVSTTPSLYMVLA